jgi:ribosome maturation factor RimP
MRREIQELWSLAEPHVRGAGLDLVELEWSREQDGWVLRVFIDRPAQGPSGLESVDFEDCERVSRDLSAALDRPLRRPEDFRRFAGQRAKIRTNDVVDGRRNFSGTLRDAHDQVVEIECDGRTYQIPVAAIVRANLVPDWDAEFRRANAREDGGEPRSPQPFAGGTGSPVRVPGQDDRSAS